MWNRTKQVAKDIYKSFQENEIQLNSATLTYYTFLALVPIIALLLMAAKRLQLTNLVEKRIAVVFQEQPQISTYIMNFAQNILQDVDSAAFKVVGFLLLLWTAMQILFCIDFGINQLWNKPPEPHFLIRNGRYIVMLFLCPLLFIIVSSASLYFAIGAKSILERSGMFHWFFHYILVLFNLLPSLLVFCLLSFIYYFVPYEKVKVKYALIAGLVAALAYEVVQYAYVALQIGVASYSAIYGTFAAIPLFLVWVHMSWMIFLLGSRFCYSLQRTR